MLNAYYVRRIRFDTKQAALDYCKEHGLSPTLIHHRSYK